MGPTLAGFIDFVRNAMGIDSTVVPDDSYWLGFSYYLALAVCNPDLACAPSFSNAYPNLYALAVYNLSGDTLINYGQDLPDADDYKNDEPFFAYMRDSLDINGFVAGVISSSADETTSESMVVIEAAKNFTMANLGQLRTPWGRQYMAIAQDAGSLWGLS